MIEDATTTPKGGRPVLHPEEKRSERLNVRFTPMEKRHVETQAHAAGIKPNEYVRRRCLGHVVATGGGRANPALVSELNRIGVQLAALGNVVNQIARYAHSDREARGFDGDWERLFGDIEESKTAIAAALDRLFGEAD